MRVGKEKKKRAGRDWRVPEGPARSEKKKVRNSRGTSPTESDRVAGHESDRVRQSRGARVWRTEGTCSQKTCPVNPPLLSILPSLVARPGYRDSGGAVSSALDLLSATGPGQGPGPWHTFAPKVYIPVASGRHA